MRCICAAEVNQPSTGKRQLKAHLKVISVVQELNVPEPVPLCLLSFLLLPSHSPMPRRNSPNEIRDLSDLSNLGELVFDKRLGQRAAAKKNRRNRHYEKQFIRNTLSHVGLGALVAAADPTAPADEGDNLS